ncbi:molybdopterin-guanine dinucleotide biosynthesis protein B [Bacillus tianshenii]|nr:molybdopterin-guanine dinucleotide biosynthesis protein B [Bacillus tianshenii]
MAAVGPPVLQIVGYKKSGKSTLMRKWISCCETLGWEVGAIKHHGHGGAPSLGEEKTDSVSFFKSGATASLVEGDGVIQLLLKKKNITLDQMIAFYQIVEPSLILIEGYKQAAFPKVVIIRNREEWEQLQHLTNIVAIITHLPFLMNFSCPVFSYEQEEAYTEWFINYIRGEML